MEIQQIPQADLLDIVFDGRNKTYGAYDLRKTYNRRLTKALAFTGSICLVLIGSYVLAGKLHGSRIARPMMATDFTLIEPPPPKEKMVIPPPPPPPKLPPQQVATIRMVSTRIVPDDQVDPNDKPQKNDDAENMKIGLVNNNNGSPDDGVAIAPPGDGGKGILAEPKKPDDNEGIPFGPVEIESAYPGGPEAWKRFLTKNFHPDQAIEQGISGTVLIQFIVDKDGNVSKVEAISGPEELRTEAVRVIRKSGKWEPAIQNGRKVTSYKRQPITVQLQTD